MLSLSEFVSSVLVFRGKAGGGRGGGRGASFLPAYITRIGITISHCVSVYRCTGVPLFHCVSVYRCRPLYIAAPSRAIRPGVGILVMLGRVKLVIRSNSLLSLGQIGKSAEWVAVSCVGHQVEFSGCLGEVGFGVASSMVDSSGGVWRTAGAAATSWHGVGLLCPV